MIRLQWLDKRSEVDDRDAHVIRPFSESKSVEFTAVSLFWYYYIYIFNTFYIHFIFCIVYIFLHNVCLVYILNIWFHFLKRYCIIYILHNKPCIHYIFDTLYILFNDYILDIISYR